MAKLVWGSVAIATLVVGACVGDSSSSGADGGMDVTSTDVVGEQAPLDAAPASDAADSSSDASDAAIHCNPTTAWNAPTVVLSNQGAQDTNASRLLPDELTMFFASSGRDAGLGDYDLYSATRATIGDAFSNVAHLAAVNTTFADDGPTVTMDGLTLYFTSNRGGASRDIYVATRSTTVSDFSAPALVSALNSSAEEQGAFVRADGQEIFFSSTRSGGQGGEDLYRSELVGSAFQTPVLEPALNTASDDISPVVSFDGLRIYFASTRTDGGAKGQTDIWQASRPNLTSAFGTPTNVAELNTTVDDLPGWISSDDCRLYLTSSRPNGGGHSLYVATRSP